MCGIFCYLGCTLTHNELLSQSNKLKHRGPDNSSLCQVGENVHFGFHRLTINGLNSKSNQPLVLDDCYLICNGEIYNHKQLARKYKFKIQTDSDCEIILHLYRNFGILNTVRQLDAEFAFILYDATKNITYFARDHLGIRPLFIGKYNDEYMFASEAKALMLCSDVRQFKPGCYGSSQTMTEMPYYNFNTMNLNHTKTFVDSERKDILLKINELLTESVKDRMMSDQKIGAFLSGGVDSSLVVAILSKYNKDIDVFTIGLEGSLDIEASKSVAKFLGLTNHHIVTYTIEEGIKAIPEVIKSLESYDITTIRASTPQWLLSKYIKEKTNVKVLLSGECIDEVCGYFFLSFCDMDEFVKQSQKMMRELHLFDLLRTDRTTMAHSLEVRVPYASKKFLNYIMNIDPKYKMFKGGMEKMILRDAFVGYLPDNILYRRKHAFSDAVSSKDVSWYKSIVAYVDDVITDHEFKYAHVKYPFNTPVSKEAYWYRQIFEGFYPEMEILTPHYWMPNIEGIKDPSATILQGFALSV